MQARTACRRLCIQWPLDSSEDPFPIRELGTVNNEIIQLFIMLIEILNFERNSVLFISVDIEGMVTNADRKSPAK